MNNKIKYGLILVIYLVGIYVTSFLLVYLNPMQQRSFGPCGAMLVLYKFLRLGDKPFEIIYTIVWTSQFMAISSITLLLADNLKLIEIDRKHIAYTALISVVYVVSSIISYQYLVAPLNHKIYGFEAGIIGPIGYIEDFFAEALICLPLFVLVSYAVRTKYRSKIGLLVANVIVFIMIFILNKITTDLWFPPLVNYGSL